MSKSILHSITSILYFAFATLREYVMRYFPLFLDTQQKIALVAGGGEAALQKVRLLLKSELTVIVMATELCKELQSYLDAKQIEHRSTIYDEKLAQMADFVFAATPCAGINGLFLHAKPDSKVNVVDKAALGNAIMPAIVDRDPIILAIGSEGTSPVLARSIKSLNEQLLEHDIGQFAELCAKLRAKVTCYVAHSKRRNFWQWVVQDAPRNLWRQKQYKRAEILTEEAILNPSKGLQRRQLLSIVKVCKEIDMIPVKAVQRLQNADIIFHEHGIKKEIFEYARRDAERIPVQEDFLRGQLPNQSQHMVFLTARRVALLAQKHDVAFFDTTDLEFIPCSCHQKLLYKVAQDRQ